MVAIVIMCTSLAEPRWISLHGGGCRLRDCIPLDHIGTYQFFYSGQFVDSYDFTCQDGMSGSHLVYKYGEDSFNCKSALKCCINIIFFEKKVPYIRFFPRHVFSANRSLERYIKLLMFFLSKSYLDLCACPQSNPANNYEESQAL